MIRETVALELLAAEVRLELGRIEGDRLRVGLRQRAAKRLANLGDIALGTLAGGGDVAFGPEKGMRDDGQLAAVMVEGEQDLADHQRHVGQPDRVGVRLAEPGLDGADEVVAPESDRAAGQRWQVRLAGKGERRHQPLERAVGVGLGEGGRRSRLADGQLAAGEAQSDVRA